MRCCLLRIHSSRRYDYTHGYQMWKSKIMDPIRYGWHAGDDGTPLYPTTLTAGVSRKTVLYRSRRPILLPSSMARNSGCPPAPDWTTCVQYTYCPSDNCTSAITPSIDRISTSLLLYDYDRLVMQLFLYGDFYSRSYTANVDGFEQHVNVSLFI